MGDSTGKNEKGSSSTHRPTSSSPPQWIIDINNYPNKEPPCSIPTISRVPRGMREVDEDNYIPKLVSIGPFHRNNPSLLRAMEEHKLRFLYGLLHPMCHVVDDSVKIWRAQNVTLHGLEKAMKELEKKTRACYSEKFDDMSSDEFVEMMLLDGCFIVELLRWSSEESEEDPLLSSRFMLHELRQDLVMLENQLPLFLLQTLYTLTGPDQDKASFNKLAISFFNRLVPGKQPNIQIMENNVEGQEHAHILALFLSTFITNTTTRPSINKQDRDRCSGRSRDTLSQKLLKTPPKTLPKTSPKTLPKTFWFSSATVLRCAGISFKNKMDGCFLEIGFENKVLEIPPLGLDKTMVKLIRNAVAFEQCDRSAQTYFTTLVLFFNTLVGSPKEVEFLRSKEIIRTMESNEEAAIVIRNLMRGIAHSKNECCIPELTEKINKFTAVRWNFWKATLSLYYFVNQEPINLLLFYLTIIQTFSSLYQIFTS